MRIRICFSIIILAALLLGVTSACNSKSAGTVTIVATDAGWDSQKVHNALAKLVIEHAYDGYVLTESTASTMMNWESMKNGDVDILIETWHENIAPYPTDIKNGDVINLGVLVQDSKQGIYVPRYVVEGDRSKGIAPMAPNLKKVDDLLKYTNIFPDDEAPNRGRLYGAVPGWMVDEILYKKYQYYGLDKSYNYVRLGSEAALFASLMSAYNLGAPWVGYCYEPTWITGKLDLILLEDAPYEPTAFMEGKTAFSTQELYNTCNRRFPSTAPEIAEFLKKYKTGSALISEALAYLDETKASYDDTAVWFLKSHDNLIDEWLPAANAKKLREYLSKK
jgi:ABC-type proline/glycine betaine transport system substrate-binding protein